MKKKYTLLILTVFLTINIESYGQSQFQIAIGGQNNDYAESIIRTADGGYAIAGETMSLGAGGHDMYIVKLSSTGSLQWSKTVGGTGDEWARSIIQTNDGGYAVAGYTSSFGAGSYDMFIIKLSLTGSLQWSKAIGESNRDVAYSLVQSTDGGYVVAGSNLSVESGEEKMYIVKLDENGSLQWSKTIGETNGCRANSIVQTSDGGYVAAGSIYDVVAGWDDMYIIKLSSNGSLQWSKSMGGTNEDEANSIVQTTDGGYAIAGYTWSFGAGLTDSYIIKLSSNGSLQWSKTVGGTNDDRAYCIVQTTDGGYGVAGFTLSFGSGSYDMYVIKLLSTGTLQWSKTVGGTNDDWAFSIIQTTDDGYAMTGWTGSFESVGYDIYIVKLDSNGNTCGNSTSPSSISGTGCTITSPASIISIINPTLTTPSPTFSSGGTVTTLCAIEISLNSSEIPSSFSLYPNYPNPFNPTTNIKFDIPKSGLVKITIYNLLGKEIGTIVNEILKPGTYNVEWNAINFSSGVYFYKLIAGDYTETKRMIIIK